MTPRTTPFALLATSGLAVNACGVPPAPATGAELPPPVVATAAFAAAPVSVANAAASTEPADARAVAAPVSPWVALADVGARSPALPGGLRSPMPGGVLAGYWADTGLDIAGSRLPVYALAAATIDYAEPGHSRWLGRNDSPFTVRLKLDEPLDWRGRRVTHVYYGHLAELDFLVHEGETPPRHLEAGQRIGVSGVARGSPHLHLGLLLDDRVEQDDFRYILHEHQIRELLQVGATGRRLPVVTGGPASP